MITRMITKEAPMHILHSVPAPTQHSPAPETCNCGAHMVWSKEFGRWVCQCGNSRFRPEYLKKESKQHDN